MNTIWIVLPILTLLMFELGLTLEPKSFLLVLRRPRAVLTGLVGQLFLLPLLAFGLGQLFDLEPIFFAGIVLIACSPGGSSSNIFTLVARGDVPLSVLLTTLSSLLTLFTIPIIMRIALQTVNAGSDAPIELPVGRLMIQNLFFVLVPVGAGILVNRLRPMWAQRLHRWLSKITVPALVFLVVVFFSQHYTTIFDHVGRLGACIALLILLAMAGGWSLARLMRLNISERRTLVIEVGMQNAAQSIAIATSPFLFASEAMAVPAILYALLMNVILLSYIGIAKLRRRPCTDC